MITILSVYSCRDTLPFTGLSVSKTSFFFFSLGLNSLKFLDGVSSPNTDNVVNTVIHALTSREPQSHYLVGLDAKALAWLAIIPTRLTDFLLNITRFTPGPKESDRWTTGCCDTDRA